MSTNNDSNASGAKPFLEAENSQSHVKRVIGVISGKGGVGKSLVTSMIAASLRRTGKNVAILDGDVTGPSIPRMFGIKEKALAAGNDLLPVASSKGTKVMSVNLILPHDTDPVIWRGPVIGNVIKQFWSDCIWGDVDYMMVDMPPGTGDVALTVFQSLPVDGIIVVASPQELVGMIVGKAVKMAKMMGIPVLALVENMSYFECPNCHQKHYIYGDSHIKDLAQEYGIDTSVQIPILPELAQLCDEGRIEDFEGEWLAPVVEKIAQIKEK